MGNSIFVRNRSVPIFIAVLTALALAVTLLSPAYGTGAVSVSFTKVLGMTLASASPRSPWTLCGAIAVSSAWGISPSSGLAAT
jgi:urea transport system permease protein